MLPNIVGLGHSNAVGHHSKVAWGIELALAAIITGNFQCHLPWQAWMADFCLGLFPTVMALPLFQRGVMLCGEVKASLLSTFELVTGVLVGVSVFGEIMTIQIAIGILLILCATAVLSVPAAKKRDL